MAWFAPPKEISTRVFARVPDAYRKPERNSWTDSNKGGAIIDSFLEGPCLDDDGAILVTDIPYGRIFRISPDGKDWQLISQYEGWPNGMKIRGDGSLLITDYRRGLVAIDRKTGAMREVLGTVKSESFKGVNDLCFSESGDVYFTDQGQTGMQNPTGRVFRWNKDGRIECLIDTCPSPNGLVLDKSGRALYVALTRACQIWRLPVSQDGVIPKGQVFCHLPGGISGPDGMAIDAEDGVIVASPAHACLWRLDRYGIPTHRILSCAGRAVTNLCFGGPGLSQIFMTDSDTGQVLVADAPVAGHPVPRA
ncbi:MAG: SMP-30/gluconolactonase/LRE family protein [Hyphomicrobiaceae bacterium]